MCAPLQPIAGHSGVTEVPGIPGFRPPARVEISHEPVRGFRCDDAVVDGAEMEVPLTGGRVARGVVRVGDTVRRPLTDDCERIHRLLGYFERSGFEAAPVLGSRCTRQTAQRRCPCVGNLGCLRQMSGCRFVWYRPRARAGQLLT